MKISNDELKTIFRGGYSYEENEDGYLHAYQHTKDQIEYFRKTREFWYVRSKAGNGKTIEFVTEATEFSFEYKFLWIGSINSIEIMVDGVIKKIYYPEELGTEGKISYTMESGEKEVVIYLATIAEIVIRNFEINAPFVPTKKVAKVLWLGDSITAGYGAGRSAHTYVNVCNRIMNYDIINQGVSGYVYDKSSLMEMKGYTPDKIIVAFGTNNKHDDKERRKCLEEYYERLTQLYPNIPVLCITPIYKNVKKEELELLIEYSGVIKEICNKFSNVTVVDGFKLVGHAQEYFVDAAHPNTLGSEVYGRNLAETIRKLKW